ncbi:MAG: glycosyltransferase family 2 protein [Candidatus Reddybacter sp.]
MRTENSKYIPGLISVVMPCYNAEPYLEEAVSSVFKQTHRETELIVVDDGSTDNSLSILNKLSVIHGDRLILLKQANQGPYPARNYALSKASGEYIAFLDADDYWDDQCLEKLLYTLEYSGADLSYCGWQNVVENGKNREPYVPPAYENGKNIYARFLKSCPWPIHAALVRATVIESANGFSTRCFRSMDYDLWIRISTITTNIILVPEVLAYYRWHDHSQISSIKWKQVLDSWDVRKTFVKNNPSLVENIPPSELQQLINGYAIRQAYDALWKRDLVSSQQLFRVILKENCWKVKDLKYIIPSLLPHSIFKWLAGQK